MEEKIWPFATSRSTCTILFTIHRGWIVVCRAGSIRGEGFPHGFTLWGCNVDGMDRSTVRAISCFYNLDPIQPSMIATRDSPATTLEPILGQRGSDAGFDEVEEYVKFADWYISDPEDFTYGLPLVRTLLPKE